MSNSVMIATMIVTAPLLVSCSEIEPAPTNPEEPTAMTGDCPRSIVSTGKKTKISHPQRPAQCKVAILLCNYCEYDGDGDFVGMGSEPCGGCVGWDN